MGLVDIPRPPGGRRFGRLLHISLPELRHLPGSRRIRQRPVDERQRLHGTTYDIERVLQIRVSLLGLPEICIPKHDDQRVPRPRLQLRHDRPRAERLLLHVSIGFGFPVSDPRPGSARSVWLSTGLHGQGHRHHDVDHCGISHRRVACPEAENIEGKHSPDIPCTYAGSCKHLAGRLTPTVAVAELIIPRWIEFC